ncbi:MAG: hypothetical protein NUW37_03300 [Planctomycetes bacterium]|nr:hypothetical protein [Planctomycetota bacterium]
MAVALFLSGCTVFTPEYWTYGGYDREERLKIGLLIHDTIPLYQKANLFRDELSEVHLSPEGLLLYAADFHEERGEISETPSKSVVGGEKVDYNYFADQLAWSGALAAALSYRTLALAKEGADASRIEESQKDLAHAIRGMKLLGTVSGVPGLYARCAFPIFKAPRGRAQTYLESDDWHLVTIDDEQFLWKGDVSKDQYSGMMYGYAIAYLAADEETRELIRSEVENVVRFLFENEFVIRDIDGEPTTYGNIETEAFCFPIGLHAAFQLAWTKLAASISSDPEFAAIYKEVAVERDLIHRIDPLTISLFGFFNRSNNVMAWFALDLLCVYGTRRERSVIRPSMRKEFREVDDEWNSLFNAIYLRHEHPKHLDPGFSEELRQQAEWTLRMFSVNRQIVETDLTTRTDIPRAIFVDRKWNCQSAVPLLVFEYPPGSFIWKSSPYQLRWDEGAGGESQVAPVDFLLAYWMMRNAGLLDPDE